MALISNWQKYWKVLIGFLIKKWMVSVFEKLYVVRTWEDLSQRLTRWDFTMPIWLSGENLGKKLRRTLSKNYFELCTLKKKVIFNHRVLRDSFGPLWKAKFTMKQPRKLWNWVQNCYWAPCVRARDYLSYLTFSYLTLLSLAFFCRYVLKGVTPPSLDII